jgi:FdhD protein
MMSDGRRASKTRMRITHVDGSVSTRRNDWLATEEPLEIRVMDALTADIVLTHVTMRTPGTDFELAAGFLLSEGIISGADQIREMEFCVGPGKRDQQLFNSVSVQVIDPDMGGRTGVQFRLAASACGVCGKASLDEIALRGVAAIESDVRIDAATVLRLPDLLRERQRLFAETGGLHGAALATADGEILAVREDVGRHNAVDKLLGWAMMNPGEARGASVLMVSGRLSFELAQKAVVGRIPVLAGVSAPSSLAVDLATEFGLTLIGFVRDQGFNIYANPQRVEITAEAEAH